jgi:predicted aspartyl protease
MIARSVWGLFIGVITVIVFTVNALPVQAQVRAIPIKKLAHLSIIEILINGQGPYEFIVDTGAGVTVIDKDLVTSLGLAVLGTTAVGSPMAEPMQVDSIHISSLTIGDVIIEDQPGVSMELQTVFDPLQAPDGILAAASLAGFLVTIDFPENIVIVRKGELPEADGRRVLEYSKDSTVPHIPISLAGQQLYAAMDTGAPSPIVVPASTVPTLPLASKPAVTGQGRTVDATFEIRSATLDGALTIGDVTIDSPTVAFSDRTSQAHIGMGILLGFSVTIDCANRRLTLEHPQAGATATPTRRIVRGGGEKSYGIRLGGLTGDALNVVGVDRGQVASAAGLMEGDRIIAMNGQPVKSLSQDERIRCLRGSPLTLRVERGNRLLDIALSLD